MLEAITGAFVAKSRVALVKLCRAVGSGAAGATTFGYGQTFYDLSIQQFIKFFTISLSHHLAYLAVRSGQGANTGTLRPGNSCYMHARK